MKESNFEIFTHSKEQLQKWRLEINWWCLLMEKWFSDLNSKILYYALLTLVHQVLFGLVTGTENQFTPRSSSLNSQEAHNILPLASSQIRWARAWELSLGPKVAPSCPWNSSSPLGGLACFHWAWRAHGRLSQAPQASKQKPRLVPRKFFPADPIPPNPVNSPWNNCEKEARDRMHKCCS